MGAWIASASENVRTFDVVLGRTPDALIFGP